MITERDYSPGTLEKKGGSTQPIQKTNPTKLTKKIIYDRHRRPSSQTHWNEKGELEGESLYFSHGQMTMRATYVKGILHGPAATYHPHGGVQSTFYYHEGDIHGERHHFDVQGHLIRKETFHKGSLHGPHCTYHMNGEVFEHGHYHHHCKKGTWQTYHPSGALHEEREHS